LKSHFFSSHYQGKFGTLPNFSAMPPGCGFLSSLCCGEFKVAGSVPMQRGLFDYLMKPVDIGELIARINEAGGR
jgi:hypothetical protein